MGKEIELEIRFGKISTNKGEDYVSLTIGCEASRTQFLQVDLSYAQFGKMLAGSMSVDAKGTVRGLANVGKTYESKKATAFIAEAAYNKATKGKYEYEKPGLQKWLREACPEVQQARSEGWEVDTYLNSQTSIQKVYKPVEGYNLNFHFYRYNEVAG